MNQLRIRQKQWKNRKVNHCLADFKIYNLNLIQKRRSTKQSFINFSEYRIAVVNRVSDISNTHISFLDLTAAMAKILHRIRFHPCFVGVKHGQLQDTIPWYILY